MSPFWNSRDMLGAFVLGGGLMASACGRPDSLWGSLALVLPLAFVVYVVWFLVDMIRVLWALFRDDRP